VRLQGSIVPADPVHYFAGGVRMARIAATAAGEQEPSMDPESQEDRSTIEDSFAEQNVRRYSARSSAVVIVGLVVVLALLYLFLR
jgi:hypothetical protein